MPHLMAFLDLGEPAKCAKCDPVCIVGFLGMVNEEIHSVLASIIYHNNLSISVDKYDVNGALLNLYIALTTSHHILIGECEDKTVDFSGVSGAPVFHGKSHAVVGVFSTSYCDDPYKGYMLAMRIDAIKKFMTDRNIGIE